MAATIGGINRRSGWDPLPRGRRVQAAAPATPGRVPRSAAVEVNTRCVNGNGFKIVYGRDTGTQMYGGRNAGYSAAALDTEMAQLRRDATVRYRHINCTVHGKSVVTRSAAYLSELVAYSGSTATA